MGLKVLWLSPVLRCGVLGRKATAVGSKAVWLPGLTWLALYLGAGPSAQAPVALGAVTVW